MTVTTRHQMKMGSESSDSGWEASIGIALMRVAHASI